MRILLIVIGWYLVSCSVTRQEEKSDINTIDETEVLKKLEFDAIAAEFKLDTGSIAPVIHERFVYIGTEGVHGKQKELEGIYSTISRRQKENHTMDSFYLDEFRADFFGNTAVVSFFTVTRGKIKEVPYENRRTRFYDVWIKEKGTWKLVSMQATPVTAK